MILIWIIVLHSFMLFLIHIILPNFLFHCHFTPCPFPHTLFGLHCEYFTTGFSVFHHFKENLCSTEKKCFHRNFSIFHRNLHRNMVKRYRNFVHRKFFHRKFYHRNFLHSIVSKLNYCV